MKVLPLTKLYSAKLGHSLIKIQLKARIREETSALMVSIKLKEKSLTYKNKHSVNSIDHQKLVKYEI